MRVDLPDPLPSRSLLAVKAHLDLAVLLAVQPVVLALHRIAGEVTRLVDGRR